MNVKKKTTKIRIILAILAVIIVSLILEIFVLDKVNRNSADNTTEVLIDQVAKAVKVNIQSEKDVVDALMKDYIVRAKSVSYILDKGTIDENDIEELKDFALVMGIDEIHIFDSKGNIVSGTNPEYYGLNFNSGKQMSYFLPMLVDKTLSMCQDTTPNTAENKDMMYAITWNEAGTRMIQVGIEPSRFLKEVEREEIPDILYNIPPYDGIDIYIAEKESGVIVASTRVDREDKTLDEIGIVKKNADISVMDSETISLDGYRNYCRFKQVDNYICVVTYSTKANVSGFLSVISVELLYMIIAGGTIFFFILRFLNVNEAKNEQFSVLKSMSGIFYSMYAVNLKDNTAVEYNAKNEVKQFADLAEGAREKMIEVMNRVIVDEFKEDALKFTDLSTLADRMQRKRVITEEFVGKRIGWFRASFIVIERDESGKASKVIYTTRSIDEEKKNEEKLIQKSNTDELTGLLNRRAYEEEIDEYNQKPMEENLVYFAFDVNGLKNVNDTLGHAAGDELLIGASECMKKSFGSNGKLFRTGGDEFVALIFADKKELKRIRYDFEEVVSKWTGKLVESMTVSYGYVTAKEAGKTSIQKVAVLADKRMYDAKSDHYLKVGIDRRGQRDAHIALCALYTKILRINITEDSYQIVNMDESEKSNEKGFSENISSWLSNFGNSGQVHPDDLKEYLEKTNLEYISSYFKNNKSSLSIFYRRKYGDEYKQVMLEMIPAKDYSDEDQNLYLYVKNIDK